MADTCKWGHPTTAPDSRDGSGFCRQCKKEVNRREYLKAKAARDVVAAFQAAGASFVNGDHPVSPDELVAQLLKQFPIN